MNLCRIFKRRSFNSYPHFRQRRLLPAVVNSFLDGVRANDCGGEDEDRAPGRVRHRPTQVADGGPQEGPPSWWRRTRLVIASFLIVIMDSGTVLITQVRHFHQKNTYSDSAVVAKMEYLVFQESRCIFLLRSMACCQKLERHNSRSFNLIGLVPKWTDN